MPYLLWLAGTGVVAAIAGGSIWAVAQPDTVINLPNDMTQSELDAVLESSPASIGDGLVSIGGGFSLVAAAAAIYLITKKG